MFRRLAEIYIIHRRKVVFSSFLIGILLVIAAAAIKSHDDKNPSRRDKLYCQRQINKLDDAFSDFSDQWLSDSVKEHTEKFDAMIDIFNRYHCMVILYKNERVAYISSNAVEPDSVSYNIIKRDHDFIFTGSRQAIPIIKRNDHKCALLLITLATENRHIKKISSLQLNKKLIPSKQIYITSYSAFGEKIYSKSGEYLFSFMPNSKSDDWLLVDILLALGLVLITITFLPLVTLRGNKNIFSNLFIAMVFLVGVIFVIDFLSLTHKLLWILPLVIYIYTNIVFHIIKKVSHLTNSPESLITRRFKIVYDIFIPLYMIMLCAMIVYSTSLCKEHIFIYLLPVIMLTAGFMNLLIGFNIVNKNSRIVCPVLFLVLISVAAIVVSSFVDMRLFVTIIILSIATFIVLIFHKYFNKITIFYIVTIPISIACSFILTGIEDISVFGEQLNYTQTATPLNFYMSLLQREFPLRAVVNSTNLFHGYFTIVLYTTITIISSNVLLLERKIYRIRRNSMSWKVHFILYLGIGLILFMSIMLSRNFVRSIKKESINMYVNRVCNSILYDFMKNGSNVIDWVEKAETSYDVNVDIYTSDGTLLYNSVKDKNALTVVPKRLNSKLVKEIYSNSGENYIIVDSYLSRVDYLSAYIIIPGNLIMHIPFNEQYTMQNFYPMITRFINVFISSLLVLLFLTTIIYNKLTQPLEMLNRNVGIIRARQRIFIKDSIKHNSEVSSIINEYNKMIAELETKYNLQITVERQNTWNKLIRVIAHEVKNPLTPILLKSQMVLYRKAKGDKSWETLIDETLNTIIEQTKRISGLITTMIESPEKYIGVGEVVKVMPLLENVKQFYSAYSRIKFNIINHTPNLEAVVFFNRENLWSVVSNITSNAIDAIILKNTINGTVSIFITTTFDKIILKIYNNGEAIPPENIPKIFDFNFTTKIDGNGLGLYLVQQIIKMENGEIYVESSDQIGTEFTIVIPRYKEEAASKQ
ncbi:MAG: HAMP domain-containing sensor histidine kinase [Rikenellaceae bacterium]